MKKLFIIIALLACCATTSYAQMEHFLPKGYSDYGFNLDLFRFPIEEENYDACAEINFETGYISEDIKTMYNHETLEFSGRLIHSSVDREMVDIAIDGALRETGIKDRNEFKKFVHDIDNKLHTLEFDEVQAWGEILGTAAVGLSAGALVTEGALATAASAFSTAVGAAGSAMSSGSAADAAMSAVSFTNGVAGQIASAKELERLANISSGVGGALDGVQMYQLIKKKNAEVYDRAKNRQYALELVRVYGFYRYFNMILNNLAQKAKATHWLIVLDENQLPSKAAVGGVPVTVSATTATTLFKIDNPDDTKSVLRRPFEGRYSGYLKMSLIYDMTNYDVHFVPNKPLVSMEEVDAGKDIVEQYLEKNRLYGGLDAGDFAETTRGNMGFINPYGSAYKAELKWDLGTPTSYSIDLDVPVSCEIRIRPSIDLYQVWAGLKPLSEGDYVKGFEEWGPVKKTIVKPDISINKSVQGTLVPVTDNGKVAAALTKYVGAKIWTENGRLYEDSYEVDTNEGLVARSLARFKTSNQISGRAIGDLISEKTVGLGIYINLKSTAPVTYITKDVVDKEYADKMHEILESKYWNVTAK